MDDQDSKHLNDESGDYILVVTADPTVEGVVLRAMTGSAYGMRSACDCTQVQRAIQTGLPSLVILDAREPIDVIEAVVLTLNHLDARIPVLLIQNGWADSPPLMTALVCEEAAVPPFASHEWRQGRVARHLGGSATPY